MKDYRLKISAAQLAAYRDKIEQRWEVHAKLGDYVVVPESDAESFGLWVGTAANREFMYIGIEPDGYTHS